MADDQNNPLNQPQDNAGAAPTDNQFAAPQPAQDPVSQDPGASVDPQGALNVEHSSAGDAAVPVDPSNPVAPVEPAAPAPNAGGGDADPSADVPAPGAETPQDPSSSDPASPSQAL